MPEKEKKESKRKAEYEAQKKSLREQKKEEAKEKVKEKGAEYAGSFFMLPPFLSRFIYHHKVLSAVIVGGVLLFVLSIFVSLFV